MKYTDIQDLKNSAEEKAVIFEIVCQNMKFSCNLINKTIRHFFTYICIGILILLYFKVIPQEYFYYTIGGLLLLAICILRLPSIFNAYYNEVFKGYKRSICRYFVERYEQFDSMTDDEKEELFKELCKVSGAN